MYAPLATRPIFLSDRNGRKKKSFENWLHTCKCMHRLIENVFKRVEIITMKFRSPAGFYFSFSFPENILIDIRYCVCVCFFYQTRYQCGILMWLCALIKWTPFTVYLSQCLIQARLFVIAFSLVCACINTWIIWK